MNSRTENTDLGLNDIALTYGKIVSSLCGRMIQDREIAKDAAQEVWLEIVKSFPTFRGQSKLSTWIYSVTHRVVTRYALNERKYSTRFLKVYFSGEQLEIPVIDDDIDKKLWIKEMCDKCLTGTLHCLDSEARLAFLFREVVQLPYEDIASIFGKDGSSVRKGLSRSRRKLRNFLTNQCILFNPQGDCNCRMKVHIYNINLQREYEKLRKMVRRVNIYLESEEILPTKNYWINYL